MTSPRGGAGQAAEVGTTGSATARQLATLATNVAVLTALLVYFGWRRTETQAARLGVDETILGLTTRDYLLRSVGPVLQLLAIIAVAGLAAVQADRAVHRRLDSHGPRDAVIRGLLIGFSTSWLLLPLIVVAIGFLAPAAAFVAFPLSIATGIVLFVYAGSLRREIRERGPDPPLRRALERSGVVIALAVTLFWATSNYAEVIGNQIADDVIGHVDALTAVTVYSNDRLGITAPGAHENAIAGNGQAYRYRYTGLRLLEHANGRYFLITDGWTPTSGAVIVLGDSSPLRFEFGANTAP